MLGCRGASAQEFIPLWEKDKTPNSRGLALEEQVVNERIRQVGTPGIYAFLPSAEENTGAAVLICPGGGYAHLAYIISGTQLAKWLNTLGISAFVLKYRLPGSPDLLEGHLAPLQDAQRAMRIIRSRARTWGIAQDRIGVMGTSAGGHLAAVLATSLRDSTQVDDELEKWGFTPNFMILVSPIVTMGRGTHASSRARLIGDDPPPHLVERYSVEKHVTPATPPTFLVHASDDSAVPARHSLMLYQALADKGIPASLHVFSSGGHAIALRNNPGSTDAWAELCARWLGELGFLQRTR